MSFAPTTEQTAAIDAAATGENTVIEAGAGAGKTSTLRLISDALAPRKGLYIAYNRAIKEDAKRSFPKNVKCLTGHGLAFSTHGKHFMAAINNAPRMSGQQAAEELGIDRSYVLAEGRELAPQALAALARDTVTHFCYSADSTIQPKHVPFVPGAEEVSWDLAGYTVSIAKEIWRDNRDPDRNKYRKTHDHYLKAWALTNPTLRYDFIFVDEAQDSNSCLMGVLLQQKAQLIAVGDRAQAIYGWRGAKDAMGSFPAEKRTTLSQSFRFGQAVADVANVFLRKLPNTEMQITGNPRMDSTVGTVDREKPHTTLCRTNAGVIQAALNTPNYQPFAIVGGSEQIVKFAEAAAQCQRDERNYSGGRKWAWHQDIGAFKSWQAVLEYANDGGEGADLKVMVNLCEDYGAEFLIQIASRAIPENRAHHVISTAHKAKGREWDQVIIADDFTPSDERQETGLSDEECMLAYVAVTRAQKRLNPSGLEWALNSTEEA